jgi:hypothetical protein
MGKVLITVALLAACVASLNAADLTAQNVMKIKRGMNTNEVKLIMGDPDSWETWGRDKSYVYRDPGDIAYSPRKLWIHFTLDDSRTWRVYEWKLWGTAGEDYLNLHSVVLMELRPGVEPEPKGLDGVEKPE